MEHSTRLPLVSIVTINYNSKKETLELIKSLEGTTFENWELIVVDNASEESPLKDIKKLNPSVTVIESGQNLGFAGGNNLALRHCKGEYIFFVNNDTELDSNCLSTLVKTAQHLTEVAVISPKFQYYHSDGLLEYAGCTNINRFTARNRAIGHLEKSEKYSGLLETHYAHGGGMLVPKRIIEEVGPMEADFFLYYEEMDWCERIRRAGYKVYCQRDALIYHKESASVGKMSPLKTYYMNRNRILFMKRNYPFPKIIPFFFFYSFVSFPKNFLGYMIKGKQKHLRALYRGVFSHLNSKLTY
ncbi:putative glycosyltransferase [Owenweeksia hongkongensis DSM 17368]|uniref:Putative glycosyltransferase n=1 Tax=Owenweeksia hongkongensis (strain DSM 17368 / CIP 108786 / JCM 12287 / NRRL B-23963 / UST20020801) TaxID=926562 RepID=G8R507_OWEHD|nr:glycosyltransferase family 2 protein [Owenweeksia hongkongensis]AEV34321.1 putative glycosyltransferase [Owenweeksia hongkongensis DSM 17368]